MNDRQLLGELDAGSQAALAACYERYRRPVYAQAYLEAGSRADAEEVMQDTFLLLWNKRRKVRLVGESMLPWLLISAKNLARNRRRYQQRRATGPLFEAATDADANPEQIAMRGELSHRIAAAVQQLDPIDQRILELCLIEGLSYREAAAQLQATHASVRNRLSRARRSLRRQLEAQGERGVS